MPKKTRFTLPTLALMTVLMAGSLGAPAVAAQDATAEPTVRAQALLRPAWLQTFLGWIDRVLDGNEPQPTRAGSMSEAVWGSGEPASPGDPDGEVLPQAGPQIDPNG